MNFYLLRYCWLAIPLVALFVDDAQAGRRARWYWQPAVVPAAAAPAVAKPQAVVPPAEKPPVTSESLPPVENRGPLINPADLKPVR